MILKDSDAKLIFHNEGAYGKRIGKFFGCEFVKLVIKPGKIIESHSLDIPVTFYVVNGKGKLTVDGHSEIAITLDIIPVEQDKERMWRNIGHYDLTILVIKHMGNQS